MRRRHRVAIGLLSHIGIAHKKLVKGCHDLAAFKSLRRAVDFLSCQRTLPRKAARAVSARVELLGIPESEEI